MNYSVRFRATLTGTISDLDVLIQNELVDSPGGKVDVTEDYQSHGILTVRFRISGVTGTAFKITYSCASDGNPTSDTNNPTPVEDSITSNGFKEIRLRIPI